MLVGLQEPHGSGPFACWAVGPGCMSPLTSVYDCHRLTLRIVCRYSTERMRGGCGTPPLVAIFSKRQLVVPHSHPCFLSFLALLYVFRSLSSIASSFFQLSFTLILAHIIWNACKECSRFSPVSVPQTVPPVCAPGVVKKKRRAGDTYRRRSER